MHETNEGKNAEKPHGATRGAYRVIEYLSTGINMESMEGFAFRISNRRCKRCVHSNCFENTNSFDSPDDNMACPLNFVEVLTETKIM